MAFSRPTLKTLIDRAIADINARLPEADARLSTSVLNVLASVQGGAVNGLYGYLDWLAAQLMVDTCEQEYLERWAGIWGISRIDASPATGTVTVTGTIGSTIPAGTLLQRVDGVQYQAMSTTTLTAATASIGVIATAGSASSSTASGTVLSFVSPVTGLNSSTTVDSGGLTGGADVETDAALRTRLLARIQSPPQGGCSNDYLTWALEVAGVTRAWLYPGELGAGTVTLRFVRDNDGTGTAILPDATEVAAVQAYIDALRPVTAQVTVLSPISLPLNFQIQGLSPGAASVKAAVQSELTDLLLREAVPGGTLLLSHIRQAISSAAGETNHLLVSPSVDVVNTTGYISTMGTITWL